MKHRLPASLAAVALLSTSLATQLHAQVSLNELLINPPGTDNGLEFVEIRSSTPAFPLDGYWLLAIEGDGAAAGTVDLAYNLSGLSTGSNGYLLLRDAAASLLPAADPATSIAVQDFNPDIENGSNTYLLVRDFTGAVGNDLDSDNDGIADLAPWAAIADGISLIENDGTANVGYAAQFGYTLFTAQPGFNADALYRLSDGRWAGSDTLGAAPGPFTVDSTRGAIAGEGSATLEGTLSPGGANTVAVIPEPTTLALLATGALSILVARRR